MDWAAKQASLQRERHSPCIGVCKLDEQTGLCIGCARSADEIGLWPSLDADARLAIWQLLEFVNVGHAEMYGAENFVSIALNRGTKFASVRGTFYETVDTNFLVQ